MPVAVRPMQAADVDAAVEIHLAAFPGFFLTFLGPAFLRQLYRGIAADPLGIASVADDDGRCVGFVAGTVEPASLYRRLLRRGLLPFAFHAGLAVLRRPGVAPRLLRALQKPSAAPPPASGRAELMSLAVLPSHRHGGLGARLVEAFNQQSAMRGATVVYLTTDAAGNDPVNHFYLRIGFNLVRTFTTPEGRAMNEYERSLS